jgi:hypothetical protein
MADVRAPFAILEDGNNVGQVVRQIQVGDSPAAKNGLLGFAFRDSAGNVVLPQLTAEGQLPVSLDTAGVILRERGTVSDLATNTPETVTGASLTLVASATYVEISFQVSCRRACLFQIVQLDDAAETILYDALVDAGQYTFKGGLDVDEIIAGATGTQSLFVRATTLDKASNVYASISAKQVVA